MTPQQIELVQTSWKKLVPIADQAAALFYARLFELDDSLKPLFKADLKSQGRKLASMINTAVVNLATIDTIAPAVQDLGRRHVDYGVRPAHYDTVGAALLWTLGQGLGDDFTPRVSEAWTQAYTTLAGVMRTAAAEREGEPGAVAATS
jgi:hemoglobin-like flavoprotein